ncbi:hypothetical protein [Altererythrobacter sp. Root672]|uniref:hypothetical protein n=1 Tax=Altererythrobacter sp. Root672 TaxID=1736584 RepID=UPI0006F550F9|nr:hypothetical protein [Altererythrobacter sp. Root672]KRA80355.1 hypothetical protein ASD76_14340 [Altererythrobacter sp. Root672]
MTRVFLVWLAVAAILVARRWSGIAERHFPDPDDVLRLVQVRDLLAGQGWFDLHQYRINPPAGTLMHWSRLVDLPLVLIIGGLTPVIGSALAEQVALVAVPLFTLGAILLAIAKTASRFLDTRDVTLACLCAGTSMFLLTQIQPMRIDHHGWQIFTVMLALTGLVPGRSLRGPALAGVALAAGLSISLEVLPVTVAFGAVFGLRWLSDPRERGALTVFLGVLASANAILFVATRGLGDLALHCDAVTPPLLGLFALAAVGAGFAVRLNPQSRPLLVVMLGIPVLAGAGLYLGTAPQCLAGPFANLDPLVREYWYVYVREGQPAWQTEAIVWIPPVAQGLIALATLAWLGLNRRGMERRWCFEYLLIASVGLLSGLLVLRSLAFVGALSAVPLGWLTGRLLDTLGKIEGPLRKGGVAVAITCLLVPVVPFAAAQTWMPKAAGTPGDEPENGVCDLNEPLPSLGNLPPATVLAPLDLGPALLEQTHHSVVATSHHRAAEAMHDVIAAFMAEPAEAREIVRAHDVKYVLLCTDMKEIDLRVRTAPNGLAARLVKGQAPDWLERVPLEKSPEWQLWKVRGR